MTSSIEIARRRFARPFALAPGSTWRHCSRVLAVLGAAALNCGISAQPAAAADALQPPASLGGLYFTGDLVYAFRSTGGGDDALVSGIVFGPARTVISSGDFSPGAKPGADVRLGWMGDSYGLEGRFFGGFDWKDDLARGAAGDIEIAFLGLTGTTNLTGSLDSKLNSGELNARAAIAPDLTVFGGIRYLDLDDKVGGNVSFSGNNASYLFGAHTTGWGPQIGAEGKFDIAGSSGDALLYVKGDARLGYLFTSLKKDYAFSGDISAHNDAKDSGGTIAAELGVTVGHDFTPNVGIEAGYRALFLPNVSTGADIMATATGNPLSLPLSPAPSTSGLVVQAITVGLHVRF